MYVIPTEEAAFKKVVVSLLVVGPDETVIPAVEPESNIPIKALQRNAYRHSSLFTLHSSLIFLPTTLYTLHTQTQSVCYIGK